MVDAEAMASRALTAQEATQDRDKLIREARQEGMSLRAIAAIVNLSHTAVAKIAAKGLATKHAE